MNAQLQLTLAPEQVEEIAKALARVLEAEGRVMVAPARLTPYTLAEAAGELNVSAATVRRMVAAGRLSRLSGTELLLIPAAEIRRAATEGFIRR